jgi:post-segregation antitoxin (ccd killing protein)
MLAAQFRGCIIRRMPQMQVYLPDDLYKLVKKGRLPASELLQDAVRAEVRRRELLAEGDKYVAELKAQVGEPTTRQRLRARAITRQIVGRGRGRQVG